MNFKSSCSKWIIKTLAIVVLVESTRGIECSFDLTGLCERLCFSDGLRTSLFSLCIHLLLESMSFDALQTLEAHTHTHTLLCNQTVIDDGGRWDSPCTAENSGSTGVQGPAEVQSSPTGWIDIWHSEIQTGDTIIPWPSNSPPEPLVQWTSCSLSGGFSLFVVLNVSVWRASHNVRSLFPASIGGPATRSQNVTRT